MINIENFLNKITGFDKFSDGFIEVVTDYTTAIYFPQDQVTEAIEYAAEMSQAGHEIHFGPAVRREKLRPHHAPNWLAWWRKWSLIKLWMK